jgi:hypothetical protein
MPEIVVELARSALVNVVMVGLGRGTFETTTPECGERR